MSSIQTWYLNQYPPWNRTRRLQTAPFLARTDTLTSRTATSMARSATRDAVVINMGGEDATHKERKHETIFGPNVGVVNKGPLWAHSLGTKAAADSLSPDLIRTWIAKSKEPSQPTTTLQALVNLKRPSLRLVPLTTSPDEDPNHDDPPHHHGLEFEYDCDAPKCRISVNVILPADHPLSENVDGRGFSRTCVYEIVVEGGFSKVLKLEDGATLELGRFERRPLQEDVSSPEQLTAAGGASAAEGPEFSSSDSGRNERSRRRFSVFHFRKRTYPGAASGPALAVVDADNGHAADDDKEKGSREDMEKGVRVAIRLSALDADGLDAAIDNEQVTYLHVVRVGAPLTETEEDTRPWVVRVIKREAIIGPYAFQLHEIYGLSSRSQTAALSPDVHTYPPTSTTAAPVRDEEPSAECLLCLSSPREVILLPCRHLVACKECAINMVEFGAGGTIVHAADTNASNAPTSGAGAEGGLAPSTSAAGTISAAQSTIVPTTTTPPHPRRKRRAKGWFCPVCRQPYTSLLRVSAMPPTKDISDDEQRTSPSASGHGSDPGHDHDHDHDHEQEPGRTSGDPVPAVQSTVFDTLRSSLRRNLRGDNESLAPDVERGVEVPPTVA